MSDSDEPLFILEDASIKFAFLKLSGVLFWGGRISPYPGPLATKPPLRCNVDSWIVPSSFTRDVLPKRSGLPGGKSAFILWNMVWAKIVCKSLNEISIAFL